MLADCLADLDRALVGERWCLIGAQAAICHGSTRATLDVDLSLLAEPADIPALRERLAAHNILPRIPDALEFAARTRMFLLWHAPSAIPIDLVLAGPGLEEAFIANATMVSLFGRDIPVLSASDVVSSKIFAGRPRDLDDVRAVLQASTVDPARIREALGLLEQALDRRDLLPVFEREWRHACREAP